LKNFENLKLKIAITAFRASSSKTVLACCIAYDVKNIAKFQVKRMEFDSNLNVVKWISFPLGDLFYVA
jgi:hypothetical protein